MAPSSHPWRIDPGPARDLADLVGWDPTGGGRELLGALADQVPAGTTAKLEAVAAGAVPPGADPGAVAARILGDRGAARPSPSWSCWALSTVMAALLDLGGRPAEVAALRRVDDRAPAVDLHSVVLTVDDDGPVVCDPYFATAMPGPGEEGREGVHRGARAVRGDEADGRWTYEVLRGWWTGPLRYRVLAPTCDRGDVAALCAVSVTHTGVPPGPCASFWRSPVAVDAFVHRDGGAAVREWRRDGAQGAGEAVLTEHPDWPAAAADLGRRVGVAVA